MLHVTVASVALLLTLAWTAMEGFCRKHGGRERSFYCYLRVTENGIPQSNTPAMQWKSAMEVRHAWHNAHVCA